MSINDRLNKLVLEHKSKEWQLPTTRNLDDEHINNLYVRLTWRVFPGEEKRYSSIDVASIDVEPKYYGQGYFRRLMLFIEILPFDYVYVENIHNPRLKEMLEKHGYQRSPYTENCCLFKFIGNDGKMNNA